MIELTADQQALQALSKALKAEEDGTKLRRDLARELRGALEPVKPKIKAALLGMGTAGIPAAGPPLRTTVLKQLKAQARLSGRSTGARLSIKKKGMPRDFHNAPKRLNRAKGWRRPVYGRDVWVQQYGEPEYFDRPIRESQAELRAGVLAAMNATAARILDRTRSRAR